MKNINIEELATEIVYQLYNGEETSPFRKRVADIIGLCDKTVVPEIFNVNFKDFEEDKDGGEGGSFFAESGGVNKFSFLFLDPKEEETKRLNILNEKKWDLEDQDIEYIIILFFKSPDSHIWYTCPISFIIKKGEYFHFPHELFEVQKLQENRNAYDFLLNFMNTFKKDIKRIKASFTAINTDFRPISKDKYIYFVNSCFLSDDIINDPVFKAKLERKLKETKVRENKFKDFRNVLKI